MRQKHRAELLEVLKGWRFPCAFPSLLEKKRVKVSVGHCVQTPTRLAVPRCALPATMETLSQDSLLECQICFNYYSPRRRPKLLDCKHTCCSVCLQQMRTSQKDLRCPWCRGITKLPPGYSVSQLPDDPEVIAVIAIPHTSEHTPVFIKLPSNGCYMLPLPLSKERAMLPGDVGCRLLPGSQQKSLAVVTIPAEQQPLQGGLPAEAGAEEPDRRGVVKSSTWSGVCTVILVACVLVFLLGIVLHNMSCISKRFTVISCG
ncbi:E3 ubiquitin-protein ligase RNF152 isoform X2 [Lagopus leucura]|uniref:E3 ubiquitin-protein ligase RNF152 isoform X2 n=1 Tax=Lagopus leucura TaxID=30410 RepID=UPI001C67CF4C|nr:E3 ubiquitin-protein ligase RNF152 isoform X2 [Lagopus leucura]